MSGAPRNTSLSTRTSHASRVHVLSKSVIKIHDDPTSARPARERAALLLLEGTNLPVPAYHSCGRLIDGRPWIMTSKCKGTPPRDAAYPAHQLSVRLAARLGHEAARLHDSVCPPGFGDWTRTPDISLMAEQRRRANLVIQLAKKRRLVQPSVITSLTASLGRYESSLRSAPARPVLVHRDLHAANTLVDPSGRITGIVGFERAGGGDPAEDFSRLALDWESESFRAFCIGYAGAGGELGDDAAERVTYYALYWAGLIISSVAGPVNGYIEPACRLISRVADHELPTLDSVIDLRDPRPSDAAPDIVPASAGPTTSTMPMIQPQSSDAMANLGLFGSPR